MAELPIDELKKLLDNLREEDGNRKILSTLLFSVVLLSSFIFINVIFSKYNLFEIPVFQEIISSLAIGGFSENIARGFITVGIVMLHIFFSLAILTVKDWFVENVFPHRSYSWDSNKGLSDWEFQGNIVVNKKDKIMHVIHSNLGCIVKNRSWDDFTMKFEFKIPKNTKIGPKPNDNQLERGFGIVFRAKKLGQYYMLKIDQNGYHPHVRNTLWENNHPIENTTLTATDLDQWLNSELKMRNNLLEAKIGKDVISYELPTYSNVQREAPKKYTESLESVPFAKIPYLHGSVGFRSSFLEEVYIRNLEVTSDSMIFRFFRETLKALKAGIYI